MGKHLIHDAKTGKAEMVDIDDLPDPTPEEIEADYQLTIPRSVTMRQFRVALLRVDKLDFFKDKVALLNEEAKEIWLVAGEMRRDDPLIAQLGFTDKQVDNFFITANQLPR